MCWVRWHDILKAVSPGFKLVWNLNSESSSAELDERGFWPGAQYVDAAGPDYDAITDNGAIRDPGKTAPNGEPAGIEA